METAIAFNEPPREDKATVRFRNPGVADFDREFRAGIIRPDAPTGVHWSLLDWIGGDDAERLAELAMEADRDDVVRVEQRRKDGTVAYFDIDIASNWPAAATGDDAVVTGWSFEE